MIENIIKTLLLKSYEVYIIGGYVRNRLLNKTSTDIDLVTNATPTELRVIFKDRKLNTVGSNFLVTMIDGIEVATYRTEVYSLQSKPTVTKTRTLFEDVQRRDLTINAMAIDPVTGELIDFFNGKSDLENRIIKFIGNPVDRINEDPIRMIRACRFLALINGTFEANTKEALKKYSIHITQIPKERIRLEIVKAMKIRKASLFFQALHDIGGLLYIFPELETCYHLDGGPYHDENVFTHNMLCGDAITTRCPLLKLTGYLHDVGKGITVSDEKGYNTFYDHAEEGAKTIEKRLIELKFSNDEVKLITELIRCHMDRPGGAKSVRKFLSSKKVRLNDYLRLRIADSTGNKSKNRPLSYHKEMVYSFDKELLIKKLPFGVKDLAVNGNDVMEILNIKPGPEVGKVLKGLLEKVIDNPELNERETLLKEIKK